MTKRTYRFGVEMEFEENEDDNDKEKDKEINSSSIRDALQDTINRSAFKDAEVVIDPTNHDVPIQQLVEHSLDIIEQCHKAVKERVGQSPVPAIIEMFGAGLKYIERGIWDLRAVKRCVEVQQKGNPLMVLMGQAIAAKHQQMKDHPLGHPQALVITAENLDKQSTDLLHSLAHSISSHEGLELDIDCKDRKQLIEWLKKTGKLKEAPPN